MDISYFHLSKFIGKVFLFRLFLTESRIKRNSIKDNRRTDHSPEVFVCGTRRDCDWPTNASSSLTLLGTSLNTYSPAQRNKNSKTTSMNSKKKKSLIRRQNIVTTCLLQWHDSGIFQLIFSRYHLKTIKMQEILRVLFQYLPVSYLNLGKK